MKKIPLRSIILAGVFVLVAVGMYFYVSKNLLTNSKASQANLEATVERYYNLQCRVKPLEYCSSIRFTIMGNQIYKIGYKDGKKINLGLEQVDKDDLLLKNCKDCFKRVSALAK